MAYTKMEFLHFHRLVHSHTMSQSDYRYSLSSYGFGCYGTGTPRGGVLEIGFVEENPLVFEINEINQQIVIDTGSIFIIPPNHRVNVSTVHPGAHRHSSVEFLIDCVTELVKQESLTPDDCEWIQGQRVILPYVMAPSRDSSDLVMLIRQLARDKMMMVEKNYFEECQAFMTILSTIAANMRQNTAEGTIPPSHRRYCQKAKEYISQHVDQHISVDEIASYVGINKNYLTNIFSVCEKSHIAEYINRIRLNRLKELVTKYNYSIRDASEAVGFLDVNYVSRIFKKYYGITLSEYRRMNR